MGADLLEEYELESDVSWFDVILWVMIWANWSPR